MIAVKVENIAAARPQVGLSQADIVFVEEVEGAQTRLVAVYHSKFPDRLGPVRSARTTDVQLLPLFGKPGLVYSGANARVQRRIDAASIVPIYRARPATTAGSRRTTCSSTWPRSRATEQLGQAQPIGWTFADKNEPGGAKADKVDVRGRQRHVRLRLRQGRLHRALAGRSATPTATPGRSPGPTMW